MKVMTSSLHQMRTLDDLANLDTSIHRIHPVSKVLTTLSFLVVLLSFGRYQVLGMIPMMLFPVIVISMANVPVWVIVKRILLVEPLIIGIGFLNPLFDQRVISVGGIAMTSGWIVFISLLFKTALTVAVALLLVATTRLDRIAQALRMLRVPRLFVLQLILTYRYIAVLIEEAFTISRAYAMRATGRRDGIAHHAWGSILGQLLLRTIDRAERIHSAMRLRGFQDEYQTGLKRLIDLRDVSFFLFWTVFFLLVRIVDLPLWIGDFMLGALK